MTLDIPSYRLQNQRLSQTEFTNPVEVVHWLGAVQSQDFAGGKWAIGLRTNGLTDPDVERAFTDGSILRTHILRPTWHFVTPADVRWLLKLSAPRVHQANAFLYRKLELDPATLKRSRSVLEKTLRGHRELTRVELVSALNKSGIVTDEALRGAYIIMHAELEGVICSGPRRGKQFTYALLEERVPSAPTRTRDEALAELTTRYFLTRGPATLHDFSWWSGLTLADAKSGIESVRSQFVSQERDGQKYWYVEADLPARRKTPTGYFLPNYDEYFIGFKDRSAIGAMLKGTGIQGDDPSLLAHIIILNGQVIGGWKRTLKKKLVEVEATLFMELKKREMHAIIEAVERYANFLQLPFSLHIVQH